MMLLRSRSFNIYFLWLLAGLLTGCKTTEEKKKSKDASTIRLHLEVNADGTPHSGGVPIYRQQPIMVNVNREPFLTEGELQEASVVEALGGFAIKLQFNRHGSLVLDGTTTSYKGRRIGIQSQFTESRWLAAPLISQRLSNGVLVFTPDATREEAERIVRGLNNLTAAVKKRSRF